MLRYTVLLHKNEDVPGYAVMVPELPGCFSQGSTLDTALANIKEAIELFLETDIKDIKRPVGQYKVCEMAL